MFLPVALLRLSLFMAAVLWLALTQLLCMLIPIGIVRRPFQRFFTFVGCSIALFALGVLTTSESLADHRRLKLPASKTGGGKVFDAKHGALVFVNQQGLTDVLYLGMRLCPVFVFTASDGTPVQLSLLGALMRAGARRPAAPADKQESLKDMATRASSGWHGPVVVFAEGARTTGLCVLAWRASTFTGMTSFEKPFGPAVLSIEYSKTGAYTPHHTVGTSFRHVFWLCLQPYHTLKSVWLPETEVAAAIRGKTLQEQTSLLRTLLVRMIPGACEVDVAAPRHVDFMAFWDASQRRGYTQQRNKRS